MVADHGRANEELATLARAKGVALPTALDSQHQDTLDQISSRSGVEFDRSYSQHMVMGHTRAVALFEAAANSPDAAVSGFANKTLSMLREHRRLADKLPGNTVKGDIHAGR